LSDIAFLLSTVSYFYEFRQYSRRNRASIVLTDYFTVGPGATAPISSVPTLPRRDHGP